MSTIVQTPVATRRATKSNSLSYSGCCIEFCTFEDSNLGVVLGEHKLDILRLTTDFYDCSDDKLQSELREQVKQTPGVDLWGSIPCTAWSTWQHMSLHVQGPEYVETLHKARLLSRKILRNFIKLADIVLENGGRVAFEWPRYATGWHLAELQNFIVKYNLFSSRMRFWNERRQRSTHFQTMESRHFLRAPGKVTWRTSLPTRTWIHARQGSGEPDSQDGIIPEGDVPMHRDLLVSRNRTWKRTSHAMHAVLR